MIYYERDNFGGDDDVKIEEFESLHYPYVHFHRNYELICLFEGTMDIVLDDRSFRLHGGQFLLVFPYQLHSFASSGTAHARACIFSPKYINEFYRNTAELYPKDLILDFSKSTVDFVVSHLHKSASKYTLKACFYAVCSEIASKTEFVRHAAYRNFSLIHQLMSFISQNYRSNISLSDAAQSLGYNYQYLSKYLHTYKLNFPDLLNQHRIDYAKHLLKNTDSSITTVAYECGYNNIRTFNRNFLQLTGLTPREFSTRADK